MAGVSYKNRCQPQTELTPVFYLVILIFRIETFTLCRIAKQRSDVSWAYENKDLPQLA